MKLLILGMYLLITSMSIYLHGQEMSTPTCKVIILLGPPGSGKGTQAVRLSKELRIPHISTGDLFRDNLSRNTDLGKKVKSYMEQGQLVPDDVVLEMLFARISNSDCKNGYLLDGFPRTIPQAEALEKHIGSKAQLIALNLQVKDETIVQRMAGRLTCRKCGFVQNRHLAPPRQEGICDKCGGELYQREDDALSVVEERLKVYHNQTEPLIHYYEKRGVLVNVNGENTPNKVFQDLVDNL